MITNHIDDFSPNLDMNDYHLAKKLYMMTTPDGKNHRRFL
ncbi:hypothetical protein HMP0015_0659 [Acinetobacter haemolyticus ATCC 19194]|uniref:Uncharacterized protein n=1 Tax=Acinetobacter haemolyticus ATCC 19194 TaxID=707232 RepID=D4XLR7_ACIHA|nr:hypothetical protein HMP0015_0659 [Acinetobacter haemolyticus ATCC 19194]